ncbi:TetR/AcrR family transcriptional regulator [Microlunatus parietis]
MFADLGFSQVGTDAIVAAAGVSRGALYHQFGDKVELFAAVVEEVERDIAAELMRAAAATDSASAMLDAAMVRWLESCDDPAARRIVLLDGPSVLGWERWREICKRHVLGLIRAALEQGMSTGEFERAPIEPLSHALIAVADEAALYVIAAEDRTAAQQHMIDIARRFVAALTPAHRTSR